MKKLMFALVAAGAAAVMADGIESQNIVGYMNKDTTEGGMTLQTPVFTATGNGTGIYLSTLKPTGYEANEDFLEDDNGTDGEFAVQTLTAAGKRDQLYTWKRSVSDGEWENDGRWQQGGTIISGANDVLIPAGTGLWTQVPDLAGDDGAEYTIVSSGEVNGSDRTFLLNVGGMTALGNPYPVAVPLSSVIPQGYEANEDFLEDDNGTDGEFAVQTLTAAGKREQLFTWKRSVSDGEWENDGRWQQGGTVISGANEFYIQPGVGLWCQCPDYAGDDDADYALKFQYPED